MDNSDNNNIAKGQLGIDDINLPKNNLFNDELNEEKNEGKGVNVKLDALQEYMKRKEKELQKSLGVVDKYFKDFEKENPNANAPKSAFDGEVATMKSKSAKKTKSGGKSDFGGNGGDGNGEGGEYGGGKLFHTDLSQVVNQSMMPFAEHVILDRALPRVEDGLKPVQRRILFTMIELGLEPDKPYRKSARIVGDCLGKYHPHGDTSVYDAMVRMAQPFLMRGQLVDGHGNFGSIDGDSAAACRYTEARLTPLALELLKDIDKETVSFTFNFDDTLKEPETLPAKFPNLLVNGANGIAVGLTTSIPPHNLGEVCDGAIAYIENKNISLDEMMKIVRAPDFPTGAYCLVNEDLKSAYETGRGKVVMRAKIRIENNGDKKNIIIEEIPYQVNKAKLLQDIVELKENNKQGLLGGIADVVDESDRNGMRGVIKLKKDVNAEKILAELYKKTQMQCNFNLNMVAVANGKPEQMGLLTILKYFVDYQQGIILKRSKFDLEQAQEKAHILTGLVVATGNIDEVVKIIKKSANTSEAKTKLMNRFELSEKQAQAILDLRLAKLTSLEIEKIQKELKELEELIKKLNAIINSEKLQLDVVKKELNEIKNKFADPRRSEIITDLEDISTTSGDDKEIVSDCVVAINSLNAIKKIPYKNFNLAQKDFSANITQNEVYEILLKTTTNKKLYLFTNKGNCHKIACSDLVEAKWKEKGEFLNRILKDFADDEKVLYIMPLEESLAKENLIFLTKQGMIKKSAFDEYFVNKYCFATCKLKDDDEIIAIFKENKEKPILIATKNAMAIKISCDEIPLQGRISGGVKAITLNGMDEVVFASQSQQQEFLFVSNLGNGKKFNADEIDLQSRARKGIKLCNLSNKEVLVFASFVDDLKGIVYLVDNELNFKEVKKIEFSLKNAKPTSILKTKRGFVIDGAWIYKN